MYVCMCIYIYIPHPPESSAKKVKLCANKG